MESIIFHYFGKAVKLNFATVDIINMKEIAYFNL